MSATVAYAGPARRVAAWLAPKQVEPLRLAIIERALLDLGLCEVPVGSNRGTRVDEYNKATYAPLGSPWCASAATAWYREAGAEVPPTEQAATNRWMSWAKKNGSWSDKPSLGAVVVYGTGGVANHVGVIVRIDPVLLSVEGNTSDGGGFEREGYIVAMKRPDAKRVLGYITPRPAPKKA